LKDNIKMDFGERDREDCGMGSCDSGYELVMDSCEHSHGLSGSLKGGEFLTS
jgi:hypothetical protein